MTSPGTTPTSGRVAGAVRRVPSVLARAIRLPPRDVLTTTQVAALFGLAELSVRFRPMAWSAARFGVALAAPAPTESAGVEPFTAGEMRGVRAVQRLSPRIYGSERGCLRRSLVLGHVLRAHRPVLRIGVRRSDTSGFAAHAWIEIAGEPIEHGNDDYLPFEFDR